jgi:hypothetical protein
LHGEFDVRYWSIVVCRLVTGAEPSGVDVKGASVSVPVHLLTHLHTVGVPALHTRPYGLPHNGHVLAGPSGAPSPAPSGPGDLFKGLQPDWGPFSKVGAEAKTIIDVIMAAVLLICLGTAVLGTGKIRLGQSEFSQDPIAVKDGRKLVIGGLIGAFLVSSMGALFTIVYGMGIPNV